MGMSMHVEAIRPGDGKWEQMKAIWDACEAGAVPVPAEVVRFFNNERPDPKGVTIDLGSGDGSKHKCCALYQPDEKSERSGFEIDLALIPEGVKKIRFYCSW